MCETFPGPKMDRFYKLIAHLAKVRKHCWARTYVGSLNTVCEWWWWYVHMVVFVVFPGPVQLSCVHHWESRELCGWESSAGRLVRNVASFCLCAWLFNMNECQMTWYNTWYYKKRISGRRMTHPLSLSLSQVYRWWPWTTTSLRERRSQRTILPASTPLSNRPTSESVAILPILYLEFVRPLSVSVRQAEKWYHWFS